MNERTAAIELEAIESRTTARIEAVQRGRSVLDDPILHRYGTSQLTLLDQEAFDRGMARIRETVEREGDGAAFVTDHEERLAIGQVERRAQTLATALARDVGDYVGLHRSAVDAFARTPGLLALSPERPIFSETFKGRSLRAVRMGELKLIHTAETGRWEWFDLAADAPEVAPQKDDPSKTEILREALEQFSDCAGRQQLRAEPLLLSPEETQRLKALGYLSGG